MHFIYSSWRNHTAWDIGCLDCCFYITDNNKGQVWPSTATDQLLSVTPPQWVHVCKPTGPHSNQKDQLNFSITIKAGLSIWDMASCDISLAWQQLVNKYIITCYGMFQEVSIWCLCAYQRVLWTYKRTIFHVWQYSTGCLYVCWSFLVCSHHLFFSPSTSALEWETVTHSKLCFLLLLFFFSV